MTTLEGGRTFHWASASRPPHPRRQVSLGSRNIQSSSSCCSGARKRCRSASGEVQSWRTSFEPQFAEGISTASTSVISFAQMAKEAAGEFMEEEEGDTEKKDHENETARHIRRFVSRTFFPPSSPLPPEGYSSLYERLKHPYATRRGGGTRENFQQEADNQKLTKDDDSPISTSPSSSSSTSLSDDSSPDVVKGRLMYGTYNQAEDKLCSTSMALPMIFKTSEVTPKCHIHIYMPEEVSAEDEQKKISVNK